MGEINFVPFQEEESFTETNLSNRFAQLGQQGIDDLTAVAFEEGCLNEEHFPSFVSYADTVEFPSDNLVATQAAVLSVAYESSWNSGSSTQTGLAYWNKSVANSPAVMNYPPNDGTWGPIENGAGGPLFITLPASVSFSSAFNARFGISALLVMMNVQVERVEIYDPANNDAAVEVSGANAPALAFVIQISNDNTNWYHLYLGSSQFVSATATGTQPYRYRLTERAVDLSGTNTKEAAYTGLIGSNNNFPSRRDVSIRTIINNGSLQNTVNAQNSQGALTSFRYIRGALSIVKPPSSGLYNKKVRFRIRKANLTAMAIRANEVDPNA